ncbi:MIP18 protein, partial [Atractosteus spatula]|nr:MIP18 protein [Atractosteus spatula]
MSGGTRLENANPLIFQRSGERLLTAEEEDEEVADPIDDREIFDILSCRVFSLISFLHLIRSINDPEHPLSLEELNVVELVRVNVNDNESTVSVQFTPTIPHCSMATLIGLSIKVKLLRSLPDRFKIDVHITPGTHTSEQAVNKQLADKERVAAALENSHLLEVVNQCLSARV